MGEKYNSKFYPDLYKKDVYYYNYEDMLGNNNRAKIENNNSNQITISQKSNHDSSIQNEKNNQSNSNDNDDFKRNIYKNTGKHYQIN